MLKPVHIAPNSSMHCRQFTCSWISNFIKPLLGVETSIVVVEEEIKDVRLEIVAYEVLASLSLYGLDR